MALSTITIGGQNVTLVDMPASPGFRTVQFDVDDPASAVVNGFSGLTQVQRWPGADVLSGTLSLPKLTQADADNWIAFLMALRGQANAFLLGDPLKRTPRGNPQHSVPLIDNSNPANNLPGSDQLVTHGWDGAGHLLEAGDWIQVGRYLYRNLFPVTKAAQTLTVWPTLRETPAADGTAPIVLRNTVGVFRLAKSQRTWNADFTRLTSLSFPFTEWRGAASA